MASRQRPLSVVSGEALGRKLLQSVREMKAGQRARETTVMLKTYTGSCHCGAVRFEADLDLTLSTFRCNCSICRRTRFWAAVVKPESFRLVQGEHELTKYLFNSRKNEHFFCRHCGVRAFGHGTQTPVGEMYGVNVACLEGIADEQLSKVPITYVDGLHDNWQDAPLHFSHM